jgi:uncharacterized RDD family membrane protein YckC
MTSTHLLPGLPDPETRPEFYAGVPAKRLFAWVVDVVLIALLTALILPFTAFVGIFFLGALYVVASFLYRWVTLARGSATIGMRLLSIEIRDRFGERLDSGTAFLHTVGYTVSVAIFPLQFISAALMLISSRAQGLSDHVLGTAAVNRAI